MDVTHTLIHWLKEFHRTYLQLLCKLFCFFKVSPYSFFVGLLATSPHSDQYENYTIYCIGFRLKFDLIYFLR